MIDKTKIIEAVLKKLENLPPGHYLDLRTYKRNRSVLVVKESEGDLLVIESGYFHEKFHIRADKLSKLLKTLLKKEFPRSQKIRLYVMGEFTEEEALNLERKII